MEAIIQNETWLWSISSLLTAIAWTNVAWYFRKPRPGAVGEFAARLIQWRYSHWLLQILRLLYYVGLPFAALFWGTDVVTERLLGLSAWQRVGASITETGREWAHDAAWAAVLGIGAWFMLALSWLAYRRSVATIKAQTRVSGVTASGWLHLREAAYHEVHWAFYRNAPILALIDRAGNIYWGVWAGLGLVLLEAVFNPCWREGLTNPRRAPAQWMLVALATVSAVLFLLTENLWLALALHWTVSWGLAAFSRATPVPTREIRPNCDRDLRLG